MLVGVDKTGWMFGAIVGYGIAVGAWCGVAAGGLFVGVAMTASALLSKWANSNG